MDVTVSLSIFALGVLIAFAQALIFFILAGINTSIQRVERVLVKHLENHASGHFSFSKQA